MRKSHTIFNISCLFVIFVLSLGTFWFARGEYKDWQREKEKQNLPQIVHREKIKKQTVTSTPVVTSSVPVQVPTSTIVAPPLIAPHEEKPLPPSMNLDVPFTSQAPEKIWTQPWQDACEEAAILMIDAYYKDLTLSISYAKEEIIKMVEWEEKKGWGLSIEIEKIQLLFEDYLKTEKSVKLVEDPTIEEIKKYIARGVPVYVVADGKVLPNPNFRNGGPEYHALVIRGYTETEFITNDPGTQFGENFKYKYQDLMDSIRDWNGGDVKSGRRVVLVVE
jgi:hypothetical protein